MHDDEQDFLPSLSAIKESKLLFNNKKNWNYFGKYAQIYDSLYFFSKTVKVL